MTDQDFINLLDAADMETTKRLIAERRIVRCRGDKRAAAKSLGISIGVVNRYLAGSMRNRPGRHGKPVEYASYGRQRAADFVASLDGRFNVSGEEGD